MTIVELRARVLAHVGRLELSEEWNYEVAVGITDFVRFGTTEVCWQVGVWHSGGLGHFNVGHSHQCRTPEQAIELWEREVLPRLEEVVADGCGVRTPPAVDVSSEQLAVLVH